MVGSSGLIRRGTASDNSAYHQILNLGGAKQSIQVCVSVFSLQALHFDLSWNFSLAPNMGDKHLWFWLSAAVKPDIATVRLRAGLQPTRRPG